LGKTQQKSAKLPVLQQTPLLVQIEFAGPVIFYVGLAVISINAQHAMGAINYIKMSA